MFFFFFCFFFVMISLIIVKNAIKFNSTCKNSKKYYIKVNHCDHPKKVNHCDCPKILIVWSFNAEIMDLKVSN